MAKNEVANVNEFAIAPIDADKIKIMTEEMDGLGTPSFDVIKIPAGGSTAFEVPGEDPDNPDVEKAVRGVIVFHHPVNAYWADEYTGGSAQPDCSSLDGKQGLDFKTGEMIRCDQCPYNQFGSGKDNKGKACKNGHRIYLLRENEMMPIILMLPPTSLKPFKDYLFKRLLCKGKVTTDVVTEISLAKDTNAGGIVYSKCSFKVGETLPESTKPIIDQVAGFVKSLAGDVSVEAAPIYDNDDDFQPIGDDDDKPF